jgi:hypothetical protein
MTKNIPVTIAVKAHIPVAPSVPSRRVISIMPRLIAKGPQPQNVTKLANANNIRSGTPKTSGRKHAINRQTVIVTPAAINIGAPKTRSTKTMPSQPSGSPPKRIALAVRTTAQKTPNVITAGTIGRDAESGILKVTAV